MRAVIDRACATAERRNLGEHLHARSAHARGTLPRRAGLERRARQDAGLGQANDPVHRRRRADLSRNDQSRGGHRRRPGDRLSRRRRAARHGVHAVPSHGAVHRRQQPQPDHRGHARRRGRGWSIATAIASCPTTIRAASWPRATSSAGRSSRRWKDAASERLSRPDAPGSGRRCGRAFRASPRTCAEFGLDITRDWIPVRPGAHYMIGGVTVDLEGRTTLPGLVGGRRSDLERPARRESAGLEQPAGRAGLRRACRSGRVARGRQDRRRLSRLAAGESPLDRARQRAVGPGRHPQLAQEPDVAQRRRAPRRRAAGGSGREHRPLVRLRACRGSLPTPHGWELQNMLTVARIMIEAALSREENARRPPAHRFPRAG